MFTPRKNDSRLKFCSKECRGADNQTRFHSANPTYRDQYYAKSKDGYFWRGLKSRAKRIGVPFELTLAEYQDLISKTTHCPVFGFPLIRHVGVGGWKFDSPSIDRFDSNKGYNIENVVVISAKANRLKNDATLREIEQIVSWMKSRQG